MPMMDKGAAKGGRFNMATNTFRKGGKKAKKGTARKGAAKKLPWVDDVMAANDNDNA
jgi:hypothetical protein